MPIAHMPIPRQISRTLATGTVGAFAAYLVALAAGVDAPAVTHGLYLAVMLAPTLAVLTRAVLVPDGRLAWAGFGIALALNWTGLAITLAHDLNGAVLDFAGLADVFWLAQYPPLLVGFAALARTRVKRPPLALTLDGLMLVLVTCAVVTAAVLPWTAADRTELGEIATLVNLTYPVADSILVAIALVGVVALGWRTSPAWTLLSLGSLALFLGDVGWLLSATAGTWEPAMPSNALYPLWAL